jgi:transcription elongation factor Elf1
MPSTRETRTEFVFCPHCDESQSASYYRDASWPDVVCRHCGETFNERTAQRRIVIDIPAAFSSFDELMKRLGEMKGGDDD